MTNIEYGGIDPNMPYKDGYFYTKLGYNITADPKVISYKLYCGLHNDMKSMSDNELIALAKSKGSATIVTAETNPRNFLYM